MCRRRPSLTRRGPRCSAADDHRDEVGNVTTEVTVTYGGETVLGDVPIQ
jgi:hypothetical protein